MRKHIQILFVILAFLMGIQQAEAKKRRKDSPSGKKEPTKSDTLNSSTFSGLKWRSIGPAFASGRIADFEIQSRK